MGALVGIRQQAFLDHQFDASGTITNASTAQLVLPSMYRRSSIILENISATNMFFEMGGARASASMSSGTVSSCSVTNAGFGYSRPPQVVFYGGYLQNTTALTFSLVSTPDFPSPSLSPGFRPAQAHCIMTGSAGSQSVSSIVVDDPGAGYIMPPYVFLQNDPTDPFGAAIPSATSGLQLLSAGGSYTANGSVCTTDQISVFCTSQGAAFTCKFTL